MKFIMKLFAVLILLVLTVSACGNSDDSDPDATGNDNEQRDVTTITIAGAGNGANLLPELASAFEAEYPDYKLDVLTNVATLGGLRGVNEGLVDIAIMTRGPNETEAENMPSLVFVPIGRVGVSLLAHPTVTVDSLTVFQLISIFAGGTTNWSEVDGPDAPIILFYRDSQEGLEATPDTLEFTLPEGFAFAENAILITNAVDMLASIKRTEYSIGYDTWVGPEINTDEIKTIKVDGVGPTESEYPITIPFGIGYANDNVAKVQIFVDWLDSEAGQTALRDLGIIIE